MSPRQRLDGLDLARLVAFCGMVIVNFRLAMGAPNGGPGYGFIVALEGRAAATFVVLAGVGLGLAYGKWGFQRSLALRAAFLLVVGLVNMTFFPADILHFYAFYFLLGGLCLGLSTKALLALAFGCIAGFLLLLVSGLDYEAGWSWETLEYAGFWTPTGFTRHVFFNGFHPVLPWLAFLLVGLALSRAKLGERAIQWRLVLFGGAAIAAAEIASRSIATATTDEDLRALFGMSPLPPGPLYMLGGIGAGAMVIGICLLVAPHLGKLNAILLPAGRMALTLYLAHIFLGMGTMEELGMLGGATVMESLRASAFFCVSAVIFAALWNRRFSRGPLEAVMRKVTG